MENVKIFISSMDKNLALVDPTFTVEAEYGDHVVEGSVDTFAHHTEEYKHCKPACIGSNIPTSYLVEPTIGVSHFDLDCLGGVMRILGLKDENLPYEWIFWDLAGFVDINGPHKLNQYNTYFEKNRYKELSEMETPAEITKEIVDLELRITHKWVIPWLNAFWAWSEENKLFAPRDGSVLDCTEFFLNAADTVNAILNGDPELLKKGQEWVAAKGKLNEDSLQQVMDSVALRSADAFTNHLYETPHGVCEAVVGYNKQHKSITISLADPIPGISCKEMVKGYWGDKAGGHDGIAGSPRDVEYTKYDAYQFMKYSVRYIKNHRQDNK